MNRRQNYYSQRFNDINNVLSDTNEDLSIIDEEIYRKKHLPDEYFIENKRRSPQRPSALKSSFSDTEDDYYHSPRSRPRTRHVVFRDDLNESLHELHQQVRDLSFEQEKITSQLNDKSNQHKNGKDSSIEERVEKRFVNAYKKLKNGNNNDDSHLRDEIKSTLDEFRKVTQQDMAHLKMALVEADKQKAQDELVSTRQRLLEIEDSKTTLSSQVQQLKEQLNKYECSQQNNRGKTHLNFESKTCKCHVEDTYPNSTSDVVRAIEKYEKQKESLVEANETLKKLVDEKESKETQLTAENINLDQQNKKLQFDLQVAMNKLQEITLETEKYASALRLNEEQLQISEMKRNELKQDAQETVKLWKTKVKKLEKAVEKYRTENAESNAQNEQLNAFRNNFLIQFETKAQEICALKDINSTLSEKFNIKELECNHLKQLSDELRNQNEDFRHELSEIKTHYKQFDNKMFNLQTEKSDLERHLSLESEKFRDLANKYNARENEFINATNEIKELISYVNKLENECKRMKSSLFNLEKSENVTKTNLSSMSSQAIQNKEYFDEKTKRLNEDLKKSQFQLQKVKLECEDSVRLMQVQLCEEKSKIELFKKRENEYLRDLDEMKDQRRRLEDELLELQTNYEKLSRNDNEKNKLLLDAEDRINKLMSEISENKNGFYNRESDYWQIINALNVDVDLITSLLSTNSNDLYKPLAIIDETEKDKAKSFYALIKSKLHWIGKEIETRLQRECKQSQTIKFLEQDLETQKSQAAANLRHNRESYEKSLVQKNMDLLQTYLNNLSESLRTHSLKEIERTHHLMAADNMLNLCNADVLAQGEKEEIFERFKQFTNTINDIKHQLESTKQSSDEMYQQEPIKIHRSANSSSSQSMHTSALNTKKLMRPCQVKQKPFHRH